MVVHVRALCARVCMCVHVRALCACACLLFDPYLPPLQRGCEDRVDAQAWFKHTAPPPP